MNPMLVNSKQMKSTIPNPTSKGSKPTSKVSNPMQKLGQKLMPKLSPSRVKGRSNNKYSFSHSWVFTNHPNNVNTPQLTKFGYDYNYNQDPLVGGNPVVADYKRAKITGEWLTKLNKLGKKPKSKTDVSKTDVSKAKFMNDVDTSTFADSFISVPANVVSSVPSHPTNFKMKWSTKEKISQAQRLSNSNYKHGNRLDYRHISNWIPNEIIHHIDGNHHNNSEDNLISIPGYIPDTNEIKTLGEWKRIVNCKLHEEIHRRACKDEVTLPSKDDILSMVDREYPNYYDEIRPKLLEHYESLKIRDKYIDGNSELEQKINKLRGM
jgi:hypothetical protein